MSPWLLSFSWFWLPEDAGDGGAVVLPSGSFLAPEVEEDDDEDSTAGAAAGVAVDLVVELVVEAISVASSLSRFRARTAILS